MAPEKDPHIALKIRSADLLIASTMPVALADGKRVELEDDYGIGPDGTAGSDYSRSLSYDGAAPKTLADLAESFDHLDEVRSTPLTEALLTGPLIDTVVHASTPYPLGMETTVTVEASLWYAADGGGRVVLARRAVRLCDRAGRTRHAHDPVRRSGSIARSIG